MSKKFDLRSDETLKKYEVFREKGGLDAGCRLCQKETIVDFTHWRIVINSFPYDRIAKEHKLLVSKQHATEDNLPKEAIEELLYIKMNYLYDKFTFMMEAMTQARSIPAHHHYHLVTIKSEE